VSNFSRAPKGAGIRNEIGRGLVAEIDSFLHKCMRGTSLKVLRKHIWRAAGYETARQLQYWQKSDPKATMADEKNFRRILDMSPADFVVLLKKKDLIKS
jgi:hypothetical protein